MNINNNININNENNTNNEINTQEYYDSDEIINNNIIPDNTIINDKLNDNKLHHFIYNQSWQIDEECILKKWADKASCLKLLHERSHKKYWCLNAWFNIPIIIISTITGTANFASSSIDSNSNIFIYVIGGFNIFGGILATIATYTGIAQKLEAHRFASISWDKFSRKIQIELSKPRKDRVNPKDFVKYATDEYDRLIEISPIISNDIIRWFKSMVELGQLEDNMDECAQCMYDCICFPCGCKLCYCCNWNCLIPKKESTFKPSWNNIELPDIIGYIKPTEISNV